MEVMTACVTVGILGMDSHVQVRQYYKFTHHCMNARIFVADIDECELGVDNCSINAVCSDTDGSYECSCITGFNGDGETCSMSHAQQFDYILFQ